MKKIYIVFAVVFLLLTIVSDGWAREFNDSYVLTISGQDVEEKQVTCYRESEPCFLSLPFRGDYIDAAIKYEDERIIIQFMYDKKYLKTTSMGKPVAEIPFKSTPVSKDITLYRTHPSSDNVQNDIRQAPVVRVSGSPLVTLRVGIHPQD